MKLAVLIGLVALVAIVVIVGYFALSNPGPVIKAAIERIGPRLTRTEVSLADAEMHIWGGTGSLRGLEIGNPAGFETDRALQIGTISFAVDTGTIRSKPIVIREVIIDRPAVTYEHDFSGSSNVEVIRDNIETFSARADTTTDGESSSRQGGEQDRGGERGVKIIIEDLHIRGANVSISARGFRGKTVTRSLPDIHLTDIGRARGGASPEEAAREIIAALTRQVATLVGSQDIPALLDIDLGTAVGRGAGKAIEAIGQRIGGPAAKQIEEAATGLIQGVGNAADEKLQQGVEELTGKLKKIFD